MSSRPSAEGPPFRPHAWLAGFHRMTLASALPRRGPPSVERRFIEVGGGTTVLTLCSLQPSPAPTLVLCHGLTGNAERPYMRGLAAAAFAAGLSVVRLNTRNCGDTEHLTPTLYHAGLVDDLRGVVEVLVGEAPGPLVLVGFSMGGNIVLRLAAQWGDAGPPEVVGVAAVSPSVDLVACQARIDGDPGLRLYRASFLRELRRLVRRKAARKPGCFDLAGLAAVTTLFEFDDRWTAPSFGFGNAPTYYREASALPMLGDLRRPALLIQAGDDRIVPPEGALRAARVCSSLRLILTGKGGHCGFVGRGPGAGEDPDRWWLDHRILDFVRAALGAGGAGAGLRSGAVDAASHHRAPEMR